MEKTTETYRAYIKILEEELVPAMGCTEPIAIAYGALCPTRSWWRPAATSSKT